MKRSEMVNIIWDAINELEDGDYILQRIEAAGMLPPAYEKRVENPIFVPDWTGKVNEWEPEDKPQRTHDDHITYEEWRKSHGGK